MAKKLGSLDTNKMYASLFGGPQEATEEQKPEKESEKRLEAETQEEPKASTKLPSVAQKPSKIPPSMEAIGLEEKPRRKLTRAISQPYRYDSKKPDELVKRSYFMSGDLILALEERGIREKRKGGSGELSAIVREALREYLADELKDTAGFWEIGSTQATLPTAIRGRWRCLALRFLGSCDGKFHALHIFWYAQTIQRKYHKHKECSVSVR